MKLKKLVAITLSAVMCMAALTGCGGKSDSAKKTATQLKTLTLLFKHASEKQ